MKNVRYFEKKFFIKLFYIIFKWSDTLKSSKIGANIT